MIILVTGANGYLGRGITRKLLEQGHTVIAADRKRAGLPEGAVYAPGDLFTVANPYLYYRSPDLCLYLASQDGFRHQSRSHIENLPHHWQCIQNLLEEGLPRIVIMGSVHEIGPHEGIVHPDTPMAPSTPYGIAKETLYRLTGAEAERLHRIFQWLRAYYVVPVTGREREAYLEALHWIEAARKAGIEITPGGTGKTGWTSASGSTDREGTIYAAATGTGNGEKLLAEPRGRAAALVRSTLQRTGRNQAGPRGGIFAQIDAAAKRGEHSFAICTEDRYADFVDYETFCEMAAAAVTQEKITGIIDLASGRPTRIVDAAGAYIAAKHYPITLRIGAYPDRAERTHCTYGDSDRIREILAAQRKAQPLTIPV